MARHVVTPLCGPDCRYRGLYEGTQTSLTDMASRQASALGRVGRLRNGIVANLKRSFGRQFSEAERQIGQRMSDLDDEILVAYLGSFLSLSALATQPAGLDDLREALQENGFKLSGDNDLTTWAEQIREQSATPSQNIPEQQPVEIHESLENLFTETGGAAAAAAMGYVPEKPKRSLRKKPEPQPEVPAARESSESVEETPKVTRGKKRRKTRTEPLPTNVPETTPNDLDDLFNPDESQPVTPAPVEKETPADQAPQKPNVKNTPPVQQTWAQQDLNDPYADVPFFEEEYDAYGEPPEAWDSQPAQHVAPEPVKETPPVPAEPIEKNVPVAPVIEEEKPVTQSKRKLTPKEPTEATVPHVKNGLDDLFDEKPQETNGIVAPVRKTRNRRAPLIQKPVESAPQPEPVTPTAPEAPTPEPEPVRSEPVTRPVAAPVQEAKLHAQEHAAEQAQETPPAPRQRTQRRKNVTPGPMALGVPLRPEVMPPPAPKGRNRKVVTQKVSRASALPPDSKLFDVPQETLQDAGGELTDEIRNAILAQVCIPRPVFTADLVGSTGAPELVAAWETEQRASNDSPVRFIPPKARHRAKGSLVVPSDYLRTAATEFTKSIWAECMKRYRGAKLYELGVLLHRINDEVVGHRLGEHTVLLRLNQKRGLVGLVVVTDSSLEEDGMARAALRADVSELLGERLELITVLTTNAEVLQPTIEALTQEAERNNWSTTMSVIAARSWEYAENRGTSATLVLGG